ncbi:MAG: OmpA family protein [Flavobacteriaceae bacterium]|nr:OmpA family protein [Flavobacteriaceae bacterium]
MKHTFKLLVSLLIFNFFFSSHTVEAQILRKLKRKIENKIEDRIERKADKEIDDVLNKKKKDSKEVRKKEENTNGDTKKKDSDAKNEINSEEKSLEVWRNYKFIPGEKVIFYDDLKSEEVGEFPSRWGLIKGGAEIATFNGEKVILGISTRSTPSRIMPLFKNVDYLSDEFTIEYDIYIDEFTKEKFNNWGHYDVYLNSKNLKITNTSRHNDIDFNLRYGEITGFASSRDFSIETFKFESNLWYHVAMSYYKGKFKLYINEKRIANLPNFSIRPDIFIIEMSSYSSLGDKLRMAIKNIRIAHGGGQMYKRIMADGKYVTNGILFDSGKATIKPQSMGVINKIASLMDENPEWKFQIIGHTDNEGSSEKNLLLSQERSKSVQNTLITLGVKAERLSTLGKGETEPLNTNSSPEEKSNNRRVEFIKL